MHKKAYEVSTTEFGYTAPKRERKNVKRSREYASKQLGHERIDVIANSYLHNL